MQGFLRVPASSHRHDRANFSGTYGSGGDSSGFWGFGVLGIQGGVEGLLAVCKGFTSFIVRHQ